jgi:hypothetical protein
MRLHPEPLHTPAGMVFADERAMALRPQGGAAWRPPGTQAEVLTPGTNDTPSLAGALQLATGTLLACLGPRKTPGACRARLSLLDATSSAQQLTRLDVVVDHYCMHTAKAVGQGLASHPRFE